MNVPIRVRLTAWYLALLALIVAGLSGFLLVRLKGDLVASIDRSLVTRAEQIAVNIEEKGGETDFGGVGDASLVSTPRAERGDQILSASGRVLQSAGDPVAERPMIDMGMVARVLSGHRVIRSAVFGSDGEPFRILAIRVPGEAPRVLVVSESLDDVNASVHRLLVLLLLAGPAVLAAAGVGGWWLARKALSPVRRMTEEAAAIGVDRLDERVAVPRTSDELQRLGTTLNAMLDRLERGVAEKRRFVADASHELRTPLAVMRSEIDVSLGADRLSAEAREVLNSTGEEVDRMTRMVDNLLTLARIDEGNMQLLRKPVEVRDVATAVMTLLRPLAAEKAVRIEVDGDGGIVQADRERLHQAVTNLVDNAVKYTGPGGLVHVHVWRANGEAGITVSDTGVGIPPDVLPRIFDRFVRGDPARTGRDGSGLGLAISREVVEAHGGRVWAESEPGRGSEFSLALPNG